MHRRAALRTAAALFPVVVGLAGCSSGPKVTPAHANTSVCRHVLRLGHELRATVQRPETYAALAAIVREDADVLRDSGQEERADAAEAVADALDRERDHPSVVVSLYLFDSITTSEREALREELEQSPGVTRVDYESKEEAFRKFRRLFRDHPHLFDNVSPDALPQSLRVTLVDASPDELDRRFSERPGVEKVVSASSSLLAALTDRSLATYAGDCWGRAFGAPGAATRR